MSVDTMAASGGNVYVARLIDQGSSDAHILDRLSRQFPGERTVSYLALLERGRRAEHAGFLMSLLDDTERLLARDVPRDGTGGLGWRFTTIISVFDPQTGNVQQRDVVVESAQNLTLGQLAHEVDTLAHQLYQASSGRAGYQWAVPDFVITNMQVLAVERATV